MKTKKLIIKLLKYLGIGTLGIILLLVLFVVGLELFGSYTAQDSYFVNNADFVANDFSSSKTRLSYRDVRERKSVTTTRITEWLLRNKELCNLKLEDVDLRANQILVIDGKNR